MHRWTVFSGFSVPLVVHFNWPRFLLLLWQSRSSNMSRQSRSSNTICGTPASEASKWSRYKVFENWDKQSRSIAVVLPCRQKSRLCDSWWSNYDSVDSFLSKLCNLFRKINGEAWFQTWTWLEHREIDALDSWTTTAQQHFSQFIENNALKCQNLD